MRKILAVILSAILMISLTACGSAGTSATSEEEQKADTGVAQVKTTEELEKTINEDVEKTVSGIEKEKEQLVAEIDTYDKFVDNIDKVEAFYDDTDKEVHDLCLRLRKYAVNYAQLITDMGGSNDDRYDALDDMYDCIYSDACDELYDGTYGGVLEDIYDDFYGGILEDGYDTAPYEEWSDVLSDEYERWSDSLSYVYEEWSDCLSDVYEFWSDMGSALYDGDTGKAKEEIAKFEEKIAELESKE